VSDVVLVDTGPLVAVLDRHDRMHDWAKAAWAATTEPVWTCEAVIAETMFLLHRNGVAMDIALAAIERGAVRLAFSLAEELGAVTSMVRRYANIPISLTDACLVRMAELQPGARILTLDSDFRVYRKHRHEPLDLLIPEA
jgi:predicted nucleic acid-binding protein